MGTLNLRFRWPVALGRVLLLAVLAATAGGCSALGAIAYKFSPPPEVKPLYVPAKVPMLVQVDATQPPDRVDITSGPTPGTIVQGNSVTVFFRGPQWAGNATHGNNLSIFSQINGVNTDTPLRGQPGFEDFSTGLSDSPRAWHNYAVRFDQADQEIEIFLDEVSLAVIDLNTFAGGIYAGFSNGAVSVGGTAGDRIWTDNFQVGAPVPEPGSLAVASLGLLFLAARRRGRA